MNSATSASVAMTTDLQNAWSPRTVSSLGKSE
jgi:hypothetical protein